jgi:hypothetical protein
MTGKVKDPVAAIQMTFGQRFTFVWPILAEPNNFL